VYFNLCLWQWEGFSATKVEKSLSRAPSVVTWDGFTANVIIDKNIHFVH
jgi:hypothetical protein